MLDGEITLEIGDESHALHAGDSIHFRADRPYRFVNDSGREATGLWASTPPLGV